jgi:probable HAF family extracellular repeat protein
MSTAGTQDPWDAHAFLFSGGTMAPLFPLEEFSNAEDINNAGQVVGSASVGGYVWRGPGDVVELGFVSPVAINDHGLVVGSSGSGTSFLWADGQYTELRTLGGSSNAASDIDNFGAVVGWSTTAEGDAHAFFADYGVIAGGGVPFDLGTLGGRNSYANGMNDSGQVVGISETAQGDPHAFLFSFSGGGMIDLGTLGAASGAQDINNAGQVVGASGGSAFLYSGGAMIDLNTLLIADTTLHLDLASDINEAGQIVGMGHTPDSRVYGFLLTPAAVPEPSSVLLLSLGLFSLLGCRRMAGVTR